MDDAPDLESTASGFREAMRRIAATVHIVTLSADGDDFGMAATAVSSLSVSPPSLLVCVNERASLHGPLAEATSFCVNALAVGSQDVVRVFSDSSLRAVRFETGDWERKPGVAPRLRGAQASFMCRKADLKRFGTHSIVIGEVAQVWFQDAVAPLIYLDGGYPSLS